MSFNLPINPKVYSEVVTAAQSYASHTIDVPGVATFAEFVNYGESIVNIRLNGDSEAVMLLDPQSSHVFPPGAVHLTKIELAASSSGASTCNVEIYLGVVNA